VLLCQLYSQYFGTPEPPIHVGVRRFPINEYFVEDLSSLISLQVKERKLANQIFEDCEKAKCMSAPSQPNMEKLYKMAAHITAHVARMNTGSSVLIFVPGLSDIESISELIEALNVQGVSFSCLPIHSDVPFEDQIKVRLWVHTLEHRLLILNALAPRLSILRKWAK
jgi:HrpA-like RNA helicase